MTCLARNKVEKRGSGSAGLYGAGVGNICRRKVGLTDVVFQLLDKFDMLIFACFVYDTFHFFW